MSAVGGDWRNGPAYDFVDEISVEKIAHEFLRRNDEYAADYALLSDEAAEEQPPPGRGRGGVGFSGGPAQPRPSREARGAAARRSALGAADPSAGHAICRHAPQGRRSDPDRVSC